MKHFEHKGTLVSLEGAEFFADSASFDFEDERVGQMLCGFAWDCGRREADLEARLHDTGEALFWAELNRVYP